MMMLGMQPYMQAPGSLTATSHAIGESRTQSSVQAWIRNIEGGLRQAYVFAAAWVKVKLPEEFSVDIFNDFGLSMKQADDIKSLIQIRLSGEISRTTFLFEMKRRGILYDMIDLEEEEQRIETEGAAMVGMEFGKQKQTDNNGDGDDNTEE